MRTINKHAFKSAGLTDDCFKYGIARYRGGHNCHPPPFDNCGYDWRVSNEEPILKYVFKLKI